MGVAISAEAINREKQFKLNQELWDYERQAEKNKFISKDLKLREQKIKTNNIEKQHLDFLRKIENFNINQKKKLEIECQNNKKILGDNRYFKQYIKNFNFENKIKLFEPYNNKYKVKKTI